MLKTNFDSSINTEENMEKVEVANEAKQPCKVLCSIYPMNANKKIIYFGNTTVYPCHREYKLFNLFINRHKGGLLEGVCHAFFVLSKAFFHIASLSHRPSCSCC